MRATLVLLCAATLHCAAASVFSGRVLEDHNGNPLPRVEIRFTRLHVSGVVAEFETDGDGRFQTPDLPDGDYVLQFSRSNYGPIEMITSARGGLTVRLVRYGAIAGKLSDFQGRAVGYAQVAAITTAGKIAKTADLDDRTGAYRIYGLAPGAYQIAVLTTSGDTQRRGLSLYPSNSAPRNFVIAGGEEYTGADFTLPDERLFRVTAKIGDPQTRATLTLVSAEHPSLHFAQGLSRPDGTFAVENVRAGKYELLATAPSTPPTFARVPVTVTAANVEEVAVSLSAARTVSVTLRSQAPCGSEATIELSAVEAWIPNPPKTALLQAEKPANLANLAPAIYNITAKSANNACHAMAQPQIDLSGAVLSKPMEVTLVPFGSIRGRILAASKPSEYSVILTQAGELPRKVALAGASGEFEFSSLPPGDYTVLAAAANERWNVAGHKATVSAGQTIPLEIRAGEGSR